MAGIETSDGCYLVAGYSMGSSKNLPADPVNLNWGHLGKEDAIIVNFSVNGCVIWTRNYEYYCKTKIHKM